MDKIKAEQEEEKQIKDMIDVFLESASSSDHDMNEELGNISQEDANKYMYLFIFLICLIV